MTTVDCRFVLHIFDDYYCISQHDVQQCLVLGRSFTSEQLTKRQIDVVLEDTADIPYATGRYLPFYAIYGIYWLLKGPYLAIVTSVSEVARGPKGSLVRKVEDIELLPISNHVEGLSPQQTHDENNYLLMLREAVQTNSLHFSYDYDLTHSLQRIANLDTKLSISERADTRFCWNYGPCSAFLERKFYTWIVPIVQAYVELVENCTIEAERFDIFYISRRSCFRQGTRFTMRGIDAQGHVTNFVETEQSILFPDGRTASIVQIRGSIPIYWSSPVTMKYAPKVYQRKDPIKDMTALQKHTDEINTVYGRVVLINLIDKKKEQLQLGTSLKDTIARLITENTKYLANLRFVWFDFHHECRKMQWHNLEKLVKQVDADFQDHGFFATDAQGNVMSVQTGVLRTNCMDNLDRTNVVQSLFARRSLLLQLGLTTALAGNVLETAYSAFEVKFKNLWGNNADAISFLYAGTGALKTDFTRTGKRTKKGLLQDGYNSCLRYILNNFYDAKRQDEMDLLLGKYIPSREKPSPFTFLGINEKVERLLLVFLMTISILVLLFGYLNPNMLFLDRLSYAGAIVGVVVGSLLVIIVKKGTFIGELFVARPLLCPNDGCRTHW